MGINIRDVTIINFCLKKLIEYTEEVMFHDKNLAKKINLMIKLIKKEIDNTTWQQYYIVVYYQYAIRTHLR